MHPAYSVIFFTVASGAGYGLWALAGLLGAFGLLGPRPDAALPWVGLVGGLLITGGLLSSTAHLGRKDRAWRAVSQWRTSWLSREAVLALAAYPLAGLYFGGAWLDPMAGWWVWLGLALAGLAAATVFATAMIYRTLRPIDQWYNEWVLPSYMSMAAGSGGLLLALVLALAGGGGGGGLAIFAAVALAFAAAVKRGYWRHIDEATPAVGIEAATGLRGRGPVRPLDPPHTEQNYLLREMGYRVARKHALKLRKVAELAGFVAPAVAALLAGLLPGWFGLGLLLLAAPAMAVGLLTERWLFFAEAKHTVTLYYGDRTG